jgi:hypothetical protein
MKVDQISEGLEHFFGAVDSLKAIVEQARSPAEAVAEARAAGLVIDYEVVDEVMRRFRAQENRNFVQRVPLSEIAKMLGGVLDTDAAPQWAVTRRSLHRIGQLTSKAFHDLDAAYQELGGFTGPSLHQVGDGLVDIYASALATGVKS